MQNSEEELDGSFHGQSLPFESATLRPIRVTSSFNSFALQPQIHKTISKNTKTQKPERFCKKCNTYNTPQWRRGPDGRKS